MIARVVVDVSLDREFDYAIPAELTETVKIGCRVTVPFGHRHVAGYVVGLSETSTFDSLKPIQALVDDKSYIDDTILKLARWMSAYYCAALEACIRTVLPGAVRRRSSKFKSARWVVAGKQKVESRTPKAESRNEKSGNEKQERVLKVLAEHNGEMPLKELLKAAEVTESPIKTLAKHGVLAIESRDTFRDPLKNYNVLPTAPLELMPEQAAALEMIKGEMDLGKGTPADLVSVESDIGPGATPVCSVSFTPDTRSGGSPKKNISAFSSHPSALPPSLPRTPRPILLYGVTGSGKTEVYLQAIAHGLEQGRGAIVLVPEISLTPQTIERFQSRFGDQIAVLHSHLSDGERHDEWHRIRDGEARVVIGARSAVFAPVANLGLVVVDEEHEPSYKQAEAPRYHARDVAVMRGHFSGCTVVLGSATPAIESWANTLNGKYLKAVLPRRADSRQMPAMRIIDMRIEAERTGHVNVFSKELLDAIEMRLNEGEQTMLFLNRRGFSSNVICPKCGFVSECDQCSVSHTYHRSEERLRCHICGGSRPVPPKCPECGDPAFRFAGVGTQRVESVANKCFPKARIVRMDADTTTRKEAYEEILGAFRNGKIDILIGTQMIAKGLHFPNVTLVGVVYADLSLHVPDFRAGERTFQLLAQVAGRAGRGDVAGQVIVQTYTPHHAAVQAARRLDYEGLCAEEMEFRSELSYPPASHLICITLKGKAEGEVKYCTEVLSMRLGKAVGNAALVSEACPAPLAKAKLYYRYQVIARGRSVRAISTPLKRILGELGLPRTVSIAVDVDAIDLM
ncbi:MAG: primosomal protein N' [Verrucomicrobia bacterium]|nr:primosomal protein N' [Verrucomicrobiota bacterium]